MRERQKERRKGDYEYVGCFPDCLRLWLHIEETEDGTYRTRISFVFNECRGAIRTGARFLPGREVTVSFGIRKGQLAFHLVKMRCPMKDRHLRLDRPTGATAVHERSHEVSEKAGGSDGRAGSLEIGTDGVKVVAGGQAGRTSDHAVMQRRTKTTEGPAVTIRPQGPDDAPKWLFDTGIDGEVLACEEASVPLATFHPQGEFWKIMSDYQVFIGDIVVLDINTETYADADEKGRRLMRRRVGKALHRHMQPLCSLEVGGAGL